MEGGVHGMMYEDAKPEHVIGKTIKEARFTDDVVELKFTDGTETEIKLTYVGYEGARLDSLYWPN